ncbi:MAG: peptidylprolyl isomerase [Gallionellaceae bacterium]|nr:peptidylprolyl isomerase [Gallionellaceae bacterium]
MNRLLAAALLLLSMAAGAETVVAPGMQVRLDYTIRADGREVDSTRDGGPVSFVVGSGAMMPGLEAALLGMRTGEAKSFDVAVADAYGEPVPDAVQSMPVTALPNGLKPEVGMMLEVRAGAGQVLQAVVRAVQTDRVVLDFNHPLAGQSLSFDVKVLAVGPAGTPYPHAAAPTRTYPGLLKINSAGVVYLAPDRPPVDPAEVAELFNQLQADANTALLQCGGQIIDTEVTGDIVKVHGVLNGPTRKTLLALVDPSTGTVTADRVMAALLAPYAAAGEHYRRKLKCDLLLAPLALGNDGLERQLNHQVCLRVERLTACLDDLRLADRKVDEAAGSHALRRYSGARWDSQVDYLDQLGAAASH